MPSGSGGSLFQHHDVISSGAGNSGSSNPVDESASNPRYPLWKYFKKIEVNGPAGGNAKSECVFCIKLIPGSYTRLKAHLLKISLQGVNSCTKLTVPILERLHKEVTAADAIHSGSQPRSVPLPMQTCSLGLGLPPSGATSSQSKRRKKQTGIEESFHLERRQMADALIARLFYTGGVSFNMARNPNYIAALSYLANTDLGGYVPPGYNKSRDTLLQQERTNVERLLEPLKTTLPAKGVSITADGWSDAQRRPLINFIVMNESGPMFLRAINTEEVKRKEYIAEKLIAVIEEVGPKNVVQVITDNAANCKGARIIVEQKYNHIFWTPCVVHTLNLALKNICAANNKDGENGGLRTQVDQRYYC